MKHSVSQRPRNNGVEIVQAITTLLVLLGIYVYSSHYTGNASALSDPPKKPVLLSSQYWNDTIGYGFTSISGDTYTKKGSDTIEQVDIRPGNGLVYSDASVHVSFYANLSIEEIESKHTSAQPRTYSRLPNGIAMIEGDLSSERAKMVLATLHSR